MEKSIPGWQLGGFVFTSAAGTFLHFLFDLTGQSVAAALISAVNESVWEHMKLIFFPMLLYALIEYRAWGRQRRGFWCVKLTGIALALTLIPVLFYTYTGIFGTSVSLVNVIIFYIAAAAAFAAETHSFQQGHPCRLPAPAAVLLLALIAAAFLRLTFSPPRIPFFRDPVTGTYGFQK